MKVALKYCGSCNPRVETGAIGRRIRELADGTVSFVPLADGQADLVVILNGCLTACADREEVRGQAGSAIVVSGDSIEFQTVPEEEIAERVVAMILER